MSNSKEKMPWEEDWSSAKTASTEKMPWEEDWSGGTQQEPDIPDGYKDFKTGLEAGTSLGASPEIAGIAGGAGDLYAREGLWGLAKTYGKGALKGMGNLPLMYKSIRDDLNKTGIVDQAKQERQQMEAQAAERSPGQFMAGNLGGAVLTSPLFALRGAGALARVGESALMGGVQGGLHSVGRSDDYLDAGKNIALSAGTAGLMQGLFTPRAVGREIFKRSTNVAPEVLENIPTNEAVKAAGEALDIKPTPGMLSQDVTKRGLESSLEQSPTLAGELVRRQTEPVRTAMGGVVDKATSGRTSKTLITVMEEVKDGISNAISKRAAPIKAAYDHFEKQFPTIAVKAKSAKAVAGNLRRSAEQTMTGSERQLVEGFADLIEKAPNVQVLKQIRTNALARMRNGAASEGVILSPVIKKLDRLIDSSILRAADDVANVTTRKGFKATGEMVYSPEVKKLAQGLIRDFKQTSRTYRELMQDLGMVSRESGISKTVHGVGDFLDKLDAVPSEALFAKLFKTNNVRFLRSMKQLLPEQFEKMKALELENLYRASIEKGPKGLPVINPGKFLHEIGMGVGKGATKKYSPEAIVELFGDAFGTKNPNEIFSHLRTLVTGFPGKVGASDTPRGLQYLELFLNPLAQGKELVRYGQYASGGVGVPKAISRGLSTPVNKLEGLMDFGKFGKFDLGASARGSVIQNTNDESAFERRRRLLRGN